jgi:LPS-assembly lipoprotein
MRAGSGVPVLPSRARRLFAVPLAVVAGLALSACTVQPLYGERADGATLRVALAGINVAPVGDRVAQIVRNELMFQLTGGANPDPVPTYEVSIATDVGNDGFIVTAPGNERTTVVSLATSYTLVVIATGEVVTSGVVRTETRFTLSNQGFAESRARQDAEQRAAVEGAELVALRLRAALATWIPAAAGAPVVTAAP